MDESLHQRLRHGTARAHRQLETFLEGRRFFATLAGYTAFLRASLGFQAEAEQALSDCGALTVIPDWPLRRRAQLARQDLEALGSWHRGGPEPASQLTKVAKPEWVLGVAYVMEGATLGGAVLLKTVAHLQVSPSHGASFLAGYGRDRGVMWQAFLTNLMRWQELGIAQEEVVHAADSAFGAARRYFETVT